MKLYMSPGACSLASHIVLHETGLPHTTVRVNLKTHEYEGGDFYKLNPKGYVPALELDNGQLLTENIAILQYLGDQKPELNLIPKAGEFNRYRAIEWLAYVSTEIHKSFSPLFRSTSTDGEKAQAKEMLAKKFDFVSKRLGDSQFLMGSQFSVADAYLFTVLNWTKGVGIDLAKWPPLTSFMERMRARPAVQKAQKAEGL